MLEILNLPPGAKVLDIACGPGWVSEFLARSGYDVVGVDISPDMIKVARERIKAVRFGPHKGQPLDAQFSVSDAETEELGSESYHAAIFYDSLHHFPDPQAVLERVFQALKPGGKLYITEGIKPPPGSEGEKKLIEAMIRFGALEKPFDQPELFDLLKKVGFVDIQAYEPLNLILKRNGLTTIPALRDAPVPMTNTILARKPGGAFDSRFPNVLKAKIRLADASLPQSVEAGSTLEVTMSLENVGDTLWLSKTSAKGGFVTLGTKLLDENKCRLSDRLERTGLPHDVPPAQTVVLTHCFTAPAQPGSYWIKLDLVSELITWFEDEGSQPFEFAIRVETGIDN
jgi:ubiquinone/menaquinone biosynthesis C-methylase UbiE